MCVEMSVILRIIIWDIQLDAIDHRYERESHERRGRLNAFERSKSKKSKRKRNICVRV